MDFFYNKEIFISFHFILLLGNVYYYYDDDKQSEFKTLQKCNGFFMILSIISDENHFFRLSLFSHHHNHNHYFSFSFQEQRFRLKE